MSEFLQVCTTLSTHDEAAALVTRLLESNLIACAQIVGPINSHYVWQGALEATTEWQCLLKTSQQLYLSVESTILNHHPYDTPEIIALPIVSGSKAYLDWLEQNLNTTPVETASRSAADKYKGVDEQT